MDTYLRWCWTPHFWLPQGLDWKDLKGANRPLASDLLVYSIPIALILIILRYFIQRYALHPLAQYTLGAKDQTSINKAGIKPNSFQEQELRKTFNPHESKPTHEQKIILAKKLDLEIRDIERWLRKRDKKSKSSLVEKFSETEWRLLSYVTSTFGSLYVHWDKNWLWDVKECWSDNFPDQSVPEDVWWCCILMTGFYLSLAITLAFDIKRKDFWALAIHHVVCILLFVILWISNYIRIAMLIGILHDFSDILLEVTKLLMYTKNKSWANNSFAAFVIVWITTRIFVFPFYLLKNFIFDRPSYLLTVPIYQLCVAGFLCILCLNVYWTYFILLMLFKAASTGETQDARSSDESDTQEDTDADAAKKVFQEGICGS